MKHPIYLDYQATTPVDPEVLSAMLPYFSDHFGNASSSSHVYGWEALEAVKQARNSISKNLEVSPHSIIFTSGATESNNKLIKGLAFNTQENSHVITQATEHKCVLNACEFIKKMGHEVTVLPVNEFGLIDPNQIKKSFKKNTRLVSMMWANNEIGTIQPISAIASLCFAHKIFFHTDAVQAVGQIPLNLQNIPIDFLSFSAHKIYGPKGVGVLYINPKIEKTLAPLLDGGGHERGLRSGTLNVPGIVGLAKALEISIRKQPEEEKRLTSLRDEFKNRVLSTIEMSQLNGHPFQRLPNNLNFSFRFVKSGELLAKLPTLALATGSACASESGEPSYVLGAITQNPDQIEGAIRIGLGRPTQKEELEITFELLKEAVTQIRQASPHYEMFKKGLIP